MFAIIAAMMALLGGLLLLFGYHFGAILLAVGLAYLLIVVALLTFAGFCFGLAWAINYWTDRERRR